MSNVSQEPQLREQIAQIASQFRLFECVPCTEAIKTFLIARGISGKLVKLFTGQSQGKYGNIYHDGLGCNISTNGRHQGIAVTIAGMELIFDNIHHRGVSREAWLANFYCLAMDLGGGFEISETAF